MNKLAYIVLEFLEELELALSATAIDAEEFKALSKASDAFRDLINFNLV